MTDRSDPKIASEWCQKIIADLKSLPKRPDPPSTGPKSCPPEDHLNIQFVLKNCTATAITRAGILVGEDDELLVHFYCQVCRTTFGLEGERFDAKDLQEMRRHVRPVRRRG